MTDQSIYHTAFHATALIYDIHSSVLNWRLFKNAFWSDLWAILSDAPQLDLDWCSDILKKYPKIQKLIGYCNGMVFWNSAKSPLPFAPENCDTKNHNLFQKFLLQVEIGNLRLLIRCFTIARQYSPILLDTRDRSHTNNKEGPEEQSSHILSRSPQSWAI